ncbi:hypothetical protein LTR33_003494 [Friedmanniomyces endolithicus]|nr:hypothetical protein LTR33_003494 [Friedmanniomyces endolithicus]
MHKKVLKKSLANKLKKERVANGKGGKGVANRPPGGSTVRSSPALSQAEKRDADEMLGSNEANDDDEDTIHIQKRQKMSRISSIASMGSQQSTVPPGSAVVEERGESADGSFGGDGEEGEASELALLACEIILDQRLGNHTEALEACEFLAVTRFVRFRFPPTSQSTH